MNKNKPLKGFRDFSRRAAHEGQVLLENKNNVLPLINKKIALFGRIQTNYYKSGTGSGGLVNVTDVPSFLDAFLENKRVDLNKEFIDIYESWVSENPFNAGNGMWASEPWSQEEMEISVNTLKKYQREDEVAVAIIGRTAGEDRDNYFGKGSYLLTDLEYQLLSNLKQVYKEVVVVLNVGNVIDMNFVKELNIDALLYAWHGGQDGARATVDILTGFITPSGKLPNTIVKDLNIYPATKEFGNKEEVKYVEGIYVGYRFFETFYPKEVLYPFGYGLSYTNFSISLVDATIDKDLINISVLVKNTGSTYGKEVVQIYLEAPNSLLGRPKRELKAFSKTKVLQPNESEIIDFTINLSDLAVYDEVMSSYVLEKGDYNLYFGPSVKDNSLAITKVLKEDRLIENLSENLRPVKPFKEVRSKFVDGKYELRYEDVLLRKNDLKEKISNNLPKEVIRNNENYQLIDVYNNKITMDEFVGSLSLDDLKHIIYGEGMSSPKVTPGTASAFGGITDSLLNKGIPLICSADGPSGIRMDSGGIATSLPNGTLLAASFNTSLATNLYELLGLEMLNYDIDIILGPGMNIQRHPLNGRNFEYFSEDPLLTGKMAAALIKGLHNVGVFGAMKHFAANNQESGRTTADSVVSERALREIYLKPFEIAVKEANASVIMTSYNPVNGIWTASNYELNTSILRDEWGFNGILMTDWWAQMNNDNDLPSKENIASMVRSQNDLYKVVPNVLEASNNIDQSLNDGALHISELQRNAKNILSFIVRSASFKKAHKLFKIDLPKLKYPYLNDSIQTSYEDQINEKDISTFDLVETKDDITYALMNKDEQTLYVYGLKQVALKNEFNEIIDKIDKSKNVFNLPVKNWEEVSISLNDYVYKNSDANDTFENISKNVVYTYNINNQAFGKYIIELTISTDLPSVQQLPLSIYIDNENKQTLTTNGTEGNTINISTQIIISEKSKHLSLKFHKTGITLKAIKVIKHG